MTANTCWAVTAPWLLCSIHDLDLEVTHDVFQACQVETDSMAVSAYIIFLSENSRDLELQEMDELLLVRDM